VAPLKNEGSGTSAFADLSAITSLSFTTEADQLPALAANQLRACF